MVYLKTRRMLAGDPGWVVVLLILFAATTRWLSFQDGVAAVGGNDVEAYRLLAEAAPGLPETVLGSAYTDRYLVHWFIGTVSAVSGLSIPWAYRLAWAVTFGVIILATHAVLRSLGVVGWPFRLCLALVVLNPYALRYYALAPAYLADVVFQAGLVLAVLGLTSRRRLLLVVGVLLAVLARQTIVVVTPVLAIWLLVQSRRQPSARASAVAAVAVVALPFAVLAAVRVLTRPFTEVFSPRIPEDTILPLLAALPSSAGTLADHVLRVLAPLLLPLSIGMVTLLIRRRRRLPVPLPGVMCALVSAAVICQPLGIGPSFAGFSGNQPRLSALGLIPLALSVGVLLVGAEPRRWSRLREAALALVVVVASLHHVYTVVGPASVTQFVLLQIVASGLAVLILVVSEWWPRAAHRAPGELAPT